MVSASTQPGSLPGMLMRGLLWTITAMTGARMMKNLLKSHTLWPVNTLKTPSVFKVYPSVSRNLDTTTWLHVYSSSTSTPVKSTVSRKKVSVFGDQFLELMGGVEPPTFSLRMRCSAIKLHQRMRCSAIKRLSEERSRRTWCEVSRSDGVLTSKSRFPTLRQRRMIRRKPYVSRCASRSVNITERDSEFNLFLPKRVRIHLFSIGSGMNHTPPSNS